MHLGDYIYEGPSADLRAHAPLKEVFTLGEYRTRDARGGRAGAQLEGAPTT